MNWFYIQDWLEKIHRVTHRRRRGLDPAQAVRAAQSSLRLQPVIQSRLRPELLTGLPLQALWIPGCADSDAD